MKVRRTPSPALAVAVLALVVSLVGTAHAAGGSLLLGAKNHATKVTKLKLSKGTGAALELVSKDGSAASFKGAADKPPFTVSSSQVVPGLNADQLDGLDSSSFLRGDTTPRTAFVVRVTPVTVPSATSLHLTPNAEQYDPSNMFSAPTLAAPVSGTYLMSATVTWDSASSGYRSLELMGGAVGGGARLVEAPAPPPANTQQSLSGIMHLDAGQAVVVQAGQSSGGPLAVTLDKLQLTYVGP